jgi:ABC-2 type transport system ATP-binding protein
MNEYAIQIQNIRRDFGQVRALDGLTLDVPSGIVFGFLGPNGAGKTTTIRLLLGLVEPTSGSAQVLGFDTRSQADLIRSHTGALLENTGIYEQLSAEDNLEFYGRVYNLEPDQRRARIRELLVGIGLWERRKERAGDWSRGMRQKLAIARAMLHRPSLVLLDEPTAGLDVEAAVAVREDLTSLAAREGVTIFLTTHNMSEAEKICKHVAVIRKGKLVAEGHPDELRARSGSPQLEVIGRGFSDAVLDRLRKNPVVLAAKTINGRLTIDLQSSTDPAPLVSLLVSEGAQVEEVRRGSASLEQVFLTLMEEEK